MLRIGWKTFCVQFAWQARHLVLCKGLDIRPGATELTQSYNCLYVIIQAIHFSSDTELFKPQKINIAHVD